jgi:hypothetical protein
MAVDPQVVVNIASEFTGKKAFTQAETATTKLSKTTKNLGKTLAKTFSVAAVLAFGRAVARAFSDAQKEAALLANSLDSINLAFAAPFIGQFIDKLALATGKAGGDLTNAFIKLSQATGDATTAQKLLQTALDISGATGKDLQSVSVALGKAFQGETTALAKLGIGYTTAELQGVKFDELLKLLNSRFGGAAAKAADTYAGKLARIGQAADLAKEKIGEGFVDGLEESGVSVEEFQEAIINLGTNIGRALGKITAFAGKIGEEFDKLKDNPVIALMLKISETIGALKGLKALGGLFDSGPADDPAKIRSAARLRRQIYRQEQENLKKNLTLTKALTKEKKDQLALDKAALALGKGEDVFDLDKIQIQAAILSKQDEINRLGTAATDQQKLQLANEAQRLTVKRLMLELEDAIADKDVKRATTLSEQLNKELAILATLQNQTYKLTDIDKILDSFVPKDLINLKNLDDAIAKLMAIMGMRFDFLSPIIPSTRNVNDSILDEDIASRYKSGDPNAIRAVEAHADALSALAESELALANALFAESERALNIATASLTSAGLPDFFNPAAFRMRDEPIRIEIIDKTSGLIEVVQNAVIENTRYGNSLTYTGNVIAQ